MSLSGIRKNINDHIKALSENLKYIESLGDDNVLPLIQSRMQAMVCMQYYFFLCLEGNIDNIKKIKSFDKKLKKCFPQYYKNVGKKIKLLRCSKFFLYPLMCSITSYNIK